MKKNTITFLFIIIPAIVFAQGELTENKGGGLVFNEYTWGIGIRTNGIVLDFSYLKMNTTTWRNLYQVSFHTYKSSKEIRLANPNDYNGRRFSYGKSNDFFSLAFNYGKSRRYYNKKDKGGIEIRGMISAGLEMGFLKPIYYYNNPNSDEKVKFNSGTHQSIETLYGKAFFTYGLSETVIVPGINMKISTTFEYSQKQYKIRQLETGIKTSLFARNVQIMENDTWNFLFASFYVTVSFGKKINPRVKNLDLE
jgi:hypothetical protein